MSLDPISIATKGYVCDGCPNPIAIGTWGYVCEVAAAVGGGDPEGAWERIRRRYDAERRRRRPEVVSRETVPVGDELADLEEQIAQLQAELEELRESPLTAIDVDELRRAFAERDTFAAMQAEEIRRDNVIYLAAVRRQMREDELAMMVEIARQRRARLSQQLAVATATVAILFPAEL